MIKYVKLKNTTYSDYYNGINGDFIYDFNESAPNPFSKQTNDPYWDQPKCLILADTVEDCKKLKNQFYESDAPVDFSSIVNPGNKIYIDSEGSSIPSLTFSRWCKMFPLNLKRSVKRENADYIITDLKTMCKKLMHSEPGYYDYDKHKDDFTRIYILKDGKYYQTEKQDDSVDLSYFKHYIEDKYNAECYFGIKLRCDNTSLGEKFVNYLTSTNIIPDYSFIKYVWNKLPVPTQEFMDTICSQLASSDSVTVSMAVDTMHNFNWQPYMFDIYRVLPKGALYFFNNSSLNANQKFLYYCLNVDQRKVQVLSGNSFYTSFFKKDSAYMNNPLLCLPDREKFLNNYLIDVEESINVYFSHILRKHNQRIKLSKREEGLKQVIYNIPFIDSIIKDLRAKISRDITWANFFNQYQIDFVLEADLQQ